MIIKINPEIISYSQGIQTLCTNKYPSHPKGCPNYGKKQGCPPNTPLINDILNFDKPVYLIYTEFNIGEHAEKLKQKHPDWSERQIYCCLYWQPKARKFQRQEEEKAKKEYKLEKIINSPEAHGVNISPLMKKIGINLEWPPRKTTRLVSLGGYGK